MKRTSNLPSDFARMKDSSTSGDSRPGIDSNGSALDPAFFRARRPRARRYRSSSRRTILLAMLLVAMLGLYLSSERGSTATNALVLADIRIEGIRPIHRPDIRQQLQPYIGRNLLLLDLATVRRDVESLPWVERVLLAKELPHRLLVRIEECRPVALVVVEDELQYLSANGRPLGPVVVGEGSIDLPIVRGNAQPDQLARIAGFLGRLADNAPDLLDQLSEVAIARGDAGSLVVYDAASECRVTIREEGFVGSYRRWLDLAPTIHQRFGKIRQADLRFQGRIVLVPDSDQAA